MVTAIGLLEVDIAHLQDVIDYLVGLPQVTNVLSVSGPFDILVHLSVESNDDLYRLITETFAKQPSIRRTETLLVFKAYSSKDMERLFSIGLEGE